jgi:hypothetical protein
MTTERTETNGCHADSPNSLRFCHNVPPFQTMFKAMGMYPLPGGIQLSGNLQGYPGGSIGASYTVTSAIAGRPLTNTSISTQLVTPDTLFRPFQTNLDLRVMRRFRSGRLRVNPVVDIFNVLNASTTTGVNQTFGQNWQRITGILRPRFLRVGFEVDF